MYQQKGFISISGLIFLVMLLFCAYLALKIIPLYYENYQLEQIMQNVVNDKANGYTMDQPQLLLKSLVKRFHVNQLKAVKTTDINMSNKQGRLQLTVSYNAQAKIIGNLYIVAHFNNEAIRQ